MTELVNENALFDQTIRKIESHYTRIHNGYGWRFAYGPRSTFAQATKIWFMGLNPGGGTDEPPEPSFEKGSVYRLQICNYQGGSLAFQKHVQIFFQLVAQRLTVPWETLIDRSFSGNVCPFRSPSLKMLDKIAPDWRQFCTELWNPITRVFCPAVVVCLGNEPLRVLSSSFCQHGGTLTKEIRRPTGWGKVTWSTQRIVMRDGPTIQFLRLPHFSRFKVLTSDKWIDARNAIIEAVSASLI